MEETNSESIVALFIEKCHPLIKERMLEEQEKQGNAKNWEIFKIDISVDRKQGAFNWEDSDIVGRNRQKNLYFWRDVLRYGEFYQFYEILENGNK